LATLRRTREFNGKAEVAYGKSPHFGNLTEPYAFKEKTLEEYLNKASLSPWTPMSESAARKMMDMAEAGPDDFHVDLGSGDGRVNFCAIDYGVKKSLGVDVDDAILQVARDRLAKRHPPPDLEFVQADLMNESDPIWVKIQQATILTMYFAKEALKLFRPILERKLVGRQMKIITCGYEMPGWESRMDDFVLSTGLHLYAWGTPVEEDDGQDLFVGDSILPEDAFLSPQFKQLEGQKFRGANVIDHTGKHPIRGYNPNFRDETQDDYSWEWSDAETDDEDEEEVKVTKRKVLKRKSTPASPKKEQ
jgi:hypothetical protein